MRVDTILTMGGFGLAGTLIGWLTLWPGFRRMAQDLRMRDWNLAHLRADHADQQLLFQTLMDAGPQIVVRLDALGQPVYVSPSCEAVLGYTPADIRRRAEVDLTRPVPGSRMTVRHRDGHTVAMSCQNRPLPNGAGAMLILTDITEHARTEALLAEARGKLRQRVFRDPLTDLANRECFLETLNQLLTDRQDVAVLLLDVDRFGAASDRYGHEIAERLLREVAGRLTLAMEGELLVARLGDDDFAVLIRAAEGDSATAARARDLIRALGEPIEAGSATVDIGASVGIAVSARDGASAAALLRAADIAMIHARGGGGDTYRFFEPRMAEAMEKSDALRRELPVAIATGAILPYFQPLVRMDDNTIVGFEVLARWSHPDHGLLSPADFLPLVEETNQSSAMFGSLLMRACRAALHWPARIKLAINVSPVELQDTRLPDVMRDILTTAGFPGERMELEITENALVHDARIAREVLDRLRALGLTIALDDFGTGFSSLYHLRELPFDKVKVDREFMRDLDTDPEASRYVAAIIDFGHALGLEITAEGIENRATLDRLRELGCTFGQGYFLGRPMPAEEADRLMAAQQPAWSGRTRPALGVGARASSS